MADIGDIFSVLIGPEDGNLSREHAQYVLSLRFDSEQVARYEDLADRIQDGKLSNEEKDELNAFVEANMILSILQLKARRSLLQSTSAA
jgi:hypothetical protein